MELISKKAVIEKLEFAYKYVEEQHKPVIQTIMHQINDIPTEAEVN